LSVLLGFAALGLERAAALFRLPVRWVWCLALTAGVILPLLPRGTASADASGADASQLGVSELLQLPGIVIERGGLSMPSVDLVLGIFWIAASVGFLLWLAWSTWRLRRESTRWTREVVDETPVLVSEDLGPAVLGPIGTAIVIPRWLLAAPAESRRLALEHERSHLAARDATLVWAATVAVIAMPWNPALWWLLARLRAAIELDCDRRVLAAGAPAGRYAELLLQMAGPSGHWLLRPTLGEPEAVLGRRILAMIGETVRFRSLRGITLTGWSGALVLLACQAEPPQAPSVPSQTSQTPQWTKVVSLTPEEGTDSLVIRVQCADSCKVTSDPASREPLFIVDGVMQAGRPDLQALEGKIESIGVLKGAAARAQYGDRAKNGIIVVFTRKR
jgi:TonB-dependent SusC/RagA subfamily outer membrane receptor